MLARMPCSAASPCSVGWSPPIQSSRRGHVRDTLLGSVLGRLLAREQWGLASARRHLQAACRDAADPDRPVEVGGGQPLADGLLDTLAGRRLDDSLDDSLDGLADAVQRRQLVSVACELVFPAPAVGDVPEDADDHPVVPVGDGRGVDLGREGARGACDRQLHGPRLAVSGQQCLVEADRRGLGVVGEQRPEPLANQRVAVAPQRRGEAVAHRGESAVGVENVRSVPDGAHDVGPLEETSPGEPVLWRFGCGIV
jgi:hypothetical protein